VESGYSLIEVLVALVILSIGTLALQEQQLFTLRAEQRSYYITMAWQQANSMAMLLANNHGHTIAKSLLTHWQDANKRLLPQGKGNIHYVARGQQITIQWQQQQVKNKVTIHVPS